MKKISMALMALWGGAQAQKVFVEQNGLVVVEAEDFAVQAQDSQRKWYRISPTTPGTVKPDPDPDHNAGAGGEAYLEILPDTRVTHDDPIGLPMFTDQGGAVAVVGYKVKFTRTGRYYVWVRAYSSGSEDNGVHVGLDSQWPTSGNKMQWCDGKNTWYWNSAQRTDANHCGEAGKIWIDIPTAGEHTISFSLREDGFEMDRWLLTTESGFARPVGVGPAASASTGGNPDPNPGPTALHFQALTDFPILGGAGFITPYKDGARGALAIDASVTANRGKFSRAALVFQGAAGTYDIDLHTLQETDGECTFRMLVGGGLVGEGKNNPTTVDYQPQVHGWKGIKVGKGDTLQVEFNTHSNGKVPEAGGFAWARGRWTGLSLKATAATGILRSVSTFRPARIADGGFSADGRRRSTEIGPSAPGKVPTRHFFRTLIQSGEK